MPYDTRNLSHAAFLKGMGYVVRPEPDPDRPTRQIYRVEGIERDAAVSLLMRVYEEQCPTCRVCVYDMFESRKQLRGYE
jgi:hypothetical protein